MVKCNINNQNNDFIFIWYLLNMDTVVVLNVLILMVLIILIVRNLKMVISVVFYLIV